MHSSCTLALLFQKKFTLILIILLFNRLTLSTSIQLDIHLVLESNTCLSNTANEANHHLMNHSSSEKISFDKSLLPHVTLYLTDFQTESIPNLFSTLRQSLNSTQLIVEISNVMVNGAYSMYQIENTNGMQMLSDSIVQSTKEFITPNQTIPEWVYNLPEPMRSKKIAYVKKYGSPNVLDAFDPHITVGYDNVASEPSRRKILETVLQTSHCCRKGFSDKIGIGVVGDFGTVLYDLIEIPFEVDVLAIK